MNTFKFVFILIIYFHFKTQERVMRHQKPCPSPILLSHLYQFVLFLYMETYFINKHILLMYVITYQEIHPFVLFSTVWVTPFINKTKYSRDLNILMIFSISCLIYSCFCSSVKNFLWIADSAVDTAAVNPNSLEKLLGNCVKGAFQLMLNFFPKYLFCRNTCESLRLSRF